MTRIAYLAPELGALTSTFVYREIRTLRDFGAEIVTFATERPRDSAVSDEAQALIAETTYLYDLSLGQVVWAAVRFAFDHPLRFLHGALTACRDVVFAEALRPLDKPKLFYSFGVGCELARHLIERNVRHIHAHFAHTPTAVTMYGAGLAGISYSFTAHANDIFVRYMALNEKVRRACFVACISENNRRYLEARGCDPAKLKIIHCGIDTSAYAFRERNNRQDVAQIFSVGRLIEKKGFAYLISALSHVREKGIPFRCRLAGSGPLLESLQKQVSDSRLEDCIELLGGQKQERVQELLSEADLFVLPCVVAADGDQDGIPVALMEAMALGVPVISSPVSGIPELITEDRNGLLSPERDAPSLAQCIESLLHDREKAMRLARCARETIEREFEVRACAQQVWSEIQNCLPRYGADE